MSPFRFSKLAESGFLHAGQAIRVISRSGIVRSGTIDVDVDGHVKSVAVLSEGERHTSVYAWCRNIKANVSDVVVTTADGRRRNLVEAYRSAHSESSGESDAEPNDEGAAQEDDGGMNTEAAASALFHVRGTRRTCQEPSAIADIDRRIEALEAELEHTRALRRRVADADDRAKEIIAYVSSDRGPAAFDVIEAMWMQLPSRKRARTDPDGNGAPRAATPPAA